ncbi:hypothetical protein [Eudoraea sp.]|uniref:hypothetical protein n=1 Tax=Eudoraea sp. TaxID=1979955 RepID=UPI003C7372A8
MKRYFILVLIFVVSNLYCQKQEKFKARINLEESNILPNIGSMESVLFVFTGDTHLINFYLDLTKHLKKRFKKSKTEIDFNYDLYSKKPLEADLELIPSKKYDKSDYKLICLVSLSEFKNWDNHLIENRKQNYKLNIVINRDESNHMVESAKINVNSNYTISTQNKNSSKLIFDLLNN